VSKKKIVAQLDPSKGGEARALSLTAERRSEIARKAVRARWAKKKGEVEISKDSPMPVAKHKGFLDIMDIDLPCYVLDNGQRVIGRVAATEMLSGIKGGGGLERYLEVKALKPFIDLDLVLERFVAFRLPEVEGLERAVKGLTTDVLIDICRAFVAALEATERGDKNVPALTDRQKEIAIKAGMFLAACAKVGLDALVDEATGYQEFRDRDALQVKLRAYLENEMRKWEKTFPDELWIEFGRLTNWKGSVTQRPKYWGHLVTQLIYEYLDPDVAQWLKEHVPQPRHGRNYHQWLSAQYGLKKLVEHIWMVIGIARTCYNMEELKQKMRQMFGKGQVQYDLFLPTPRQAQPLAKQPLTPEQVEAEKAEIVS
jgi:hypothetical protein